MTAPQESESAQASESQVNDSITTRPIRKRKLTPFLCHEMLYEYHCGLLDRERRAAVEEFLETDKEGQSILAAIRDGLSYADSLTETQLAPETHAYLKDAENVFSLGRRYSSWREWPEAVRWSMNALIISASVAVVVSAVPWQSIKSLLPKRSAQTSVELAQIPNSGESAQGGHEEGSGEAGAHGQAVAQQGSESHGEEDEESPLDVHLKPSDLAGAAPEPTAPPLMDAKAVAANEKAADAKAAANVASNKASNAASNIAVNTGSNVASNPVAKAGSANPMNAKPEAVAPSVQVQATEPTQLAEKKDAKAKGFVYRAFMTLNDLPTLAPKITEEIRSLGGEKAGEVELGWKRGTGHYYHFALPQSNEERLLEKLRAYGPVRISKDPHPRVMPEGQVRFILWIESAE